MKARANFPAYLLLMVFGILLSPLLTPADAVTWLGGVDLGKYCRSIGGDGSEVSLQGQTAYSWHCKDKNGQELPVSVFQACKVTHNDPNAVDWLGNYFNPYSWACFTKARQLPSINLKGYCISQGYVDVDIPGPTAYNIYCRKVSGERGELSPNAERTTGLTPTKACQWTWGNLGVVARLPNYNDPRSWQCWW